MTSGEVQLKRYGGSPGGAVGLIGLRSPVGRWKRDSVAVLRLGVDGVGIGGIDLRVHAVAGVDLHPVVVEDAEIVARGARAAERVRVLQAAVDVVRRRHVDADPVELADRQVVHLVPGDAAVEGEVEPAVVAEDEVLRVGGIDPERVMIAVHADVVGRAHACRWRRARPVTGSRERPAAVVGDEQRRAEDVEALVVGRIDVDLAVVHRPRVDVAHLPPRLAAVVGTVGAALGPVLDGGVDHPRIPAPDGQADAPDGALRQAARSACVHVRPPSAVL